MEIDINARISPNIVQNYEAAINELSRIRAVEDARAILERLLAKTGLTHAVYYLPRPTHDEENSDTIIMTYPRQWIERYFAMNYLKLDPVVYISARTLLPVDWHLLPQKEKKIIKFFGEAKEFGVGPNGLTFNIRGPQLRYALFTVTSDMNNIQWAAFKKYELPHLVYFANTFHKKIFELKNPTSKDAQPKLSPREIECLSLNASGLRDAEIADLLSIQEAVVRHYMDSARWKLGAANRTYAAIQATKLGIIIP